MVADRAAGCRARDAMMAGDVARYTAHRGALGAALGLSDVRRGTERRGKRERGGAASKERLE
jgi:hypothetical protein